MNTNNEKNFEDWTQEERDRVFGFFDLLIKADKRQKPDLYSKPQSEMVVLDKDGNKIKL